MILDSQALEHLEIFETAEHFEKGSLFSYINKTVTPFGKRLLRKWLMRPLLSQSAIEDRLDAVEDLEKDCILRENL